VNGELDQGQRDSEVAEGDEERGSDQSDGIQLSIHLF